MPKNILLISWIDEKTFSHKCIRTLKWFQSVQKILQCFIHAISLVTRLFQEKTLKFFFLFFYLDILNLRNINRIIIL